MPLKTATVVYSRFVRFIPFALCGIIILVALGWILSGKHPLASWVLLVAGGGLFALGIYDLLQPKHSILRNYPLTGHFRYLFEKVRPQIRQYFVEGELEAEPFSREQRSLVYQRAKGQPDVRPFGTILNVGNKGYEWINHSLHTTHIPSHDFRIWIGGQPGQPQEGVSPCSKPYSASVFNISAMSFGALSAHAVMAMNQGAKMGGFAQDTGEGGISRYHRKFDGDLIWEIGSGYFGCRNQDGTFSEALFTEQAQLDQVKMIEIKLSQGAKPGHGGMLPAAKVTAEIARARGVPEGVDCISPASHSAFSTPVELMQFIAKLRQLSGGKPVGFKLCIGHLWEWFAMVKAMLETNITPDFIVVDGAEGGTGAAPAELTDHVGAPVAEGLHLVNNTLIGTGLRHRIRLGAAGKIISAFDMVRMFALGADWVNSGRGFMMAVGCLQARVCHTGLCPVGVTTQDPIRQNALKVDAKAPRVTQFHANTLDALREMLQTAGLNHPDELTSFHIVRRIGDSQIRLLSAIMPNMPENGILNNLDHQQNVYRLYWPLANPHSFSPNMAMAGEAPFDIESTLPRSKTGAPRSAMEIARALGHPQAQHPEPISHVVPGRSAAQAESLSDEPTQVPGAWQASAGDVEDALKDDDLPPNVS